MGSERRTMEALDEESLAEAEQMFVKRGCCCFWVPSFTSNSCPPATSSSSSWWERIRTAEKCSRGGPLGGGRKDSLWKRGLRVLLKVREWSEIVAGPRWKTFLRRFNRKGRAPGERPRRFQYDPLSYALNFDEGQSGDADADTAYRGFSARYVTPPVSAKSSMDLGGRDAPSLFAEAG